MRAANTVNMTRTFRSLGNFVAFAARFCNISIKVETKKPTDALYISVAHPSGRVCKCQVGLIRAKSKLMDRACEACDQAGELEITLFVQLER